MKKQLKHFFVLLSLLFLFLSLFAGCDPLVTTLSMDVHYTTGRAYVGANESTGVQIFYRNNENEEIFYDGKTAFYNLYPDSVDEIFLCGFLTIKSRSIGKISIQSVEYNICVYKDYYGVYFLDTDAMKSAEQEGLVYIGRNYIGEDSEQGLFSFEDFCEKFVLLQMEMQCHSDEHFSGTVIGGTLLESGTKIDFYYQK